MCSCNTFRASLHLNASFVTVFEETPSRQTRLLNFLDVQIVFFFSLFYLAQRTMDRKCELFTAVLATRSRKQ